MFWLFDRQEFGILALSPEIKSAPRTLVGKVLTTGLPVKSPSGFLSTSDF